MLVFHVASINVSLYEKEIIFETFINFDIYNVY